MRVNPGNPNMSYLITKLEGPGASGGQMPPSGPMPQAEIDVIRQWIMDGAVDDTVVPNVPIQVTTLSPAPNSNLTVPPTQIIAGFSREPVPASVDLNTFLLVGNGPDGIFDNADDIVVTADSITVPAANPQSAIFDFSGTVLPDGTYRVTLLGNGATVISDMDGNALDGEYSGSFPSGNGIAGGDFIAQFTVTTPIVIGPTLDQIQTVIFTPTCATAGCHSGGVPAANLNLSNADTSHLELVGVATTDFAGGRTRVIPFDPDNSYLVQKLQGVNIQGAQMPLGRPPLAQTDIDHIRQWIMDGALR
jgi:hypothetical protein